MRYQIWNGTDDIYTPSGEKFSAEKWAARYPWAKIPGAKMIITAGIINGGAAMEFGATVAAYKARGAAITDGMTDEQVLAAIEDFEDNPPGANEPSSEERIAAALEAQVMMAEPETAAVTLMEEAYVSEEPGAMEEPSASAGAAPSPALERVRRNFQRGLWSAGMVEAAAARGYISMAEASELLGV